MPTWNYHSHVKVCPDCNGVGEVASHHRPSINDPYPSQPCENCDGPHEPECSVCGFNQQVAGYDCLACDTAASLHTHELRAFDAAAFTDALTVAIGKALVSVERKAA